MLKKILALLLISAFIITMLPVSTAYAYDELKNTDPEKYYIMLDLKNQIVTVYEKDDNGEYSKIVRRFVCTSGRTESNVVVDPENPNAPIDPMDLPKPTPTGIFKIGGRERFGKFAAFGGTYARYWTQVVNGIYFHSIMFDARDVDTLQSSAFRRLGSKGSHGCVRLYVEDAKWMYYYACPGTTVEITNKLPADRTTAKKLKTSLSFSDYNAMQKKIFDNDELPNLTAWVVKDNADMRTGNGFNDKVIKRLSIDTEVEILQSAEPWCKVKYDGKEGYIRTAYLTFEKGTINSKEDADIMDSIAWLYAEPSEDSETMVRIPVFSSVKIIEPDKDGWTKVQFWDDIGYVETKYIEKGWGVIRD